MHPTLFEIFGQRIPSYFGMLALGFGLAIWMAARQARRMGLDHNVMIDLGLFSLVWGVIGGRVLHVFADGYFWDYVHLCTDPSLVSWETTQAHCDQLGGVWDSAASVCHPTQRDCFAWLAFWNGGLAYYGGLIAASFFGVRFLKKEGFPLWRGIDLVGLVLPIGLFFGRIGCFLGGCCFGQRVPDTFLLGVRFPASSDASYAHWREGLLQWPNVHSLPVHPTQLYEALGCLLIFAAGVFLRPRKRFDGQLMLSFLGLYAALRFGIEFFRADARGALFGVSTSQWIGLLVIAFVAWLWRKRAQANTAQGPHAGQDTASLSDES